MSVPSPARDTSSPITVNNGIVASVPVSETTVLVEVLYVRFVVPVNVALVFMVTLADPSKLAEPVRSPVREIVRAVSSVDAVEALPINDAVILRAVKSPEPSRATIALPEFKFVAVAVKEEPFDNLPHPDEQLGLQGSHVDLPKLLPFEELIPISSEGSGRCDKSKGSSHYGSPQNRPTIKERFLPHGHSEMFQKVLMCYL